jgi:DNA polymerase III sliding clamp (beta) subunit (PCNA family)
MSIHTDVRALSLVTPNQNERKTTRMSKIALPVAELKSALTGFGKVISRRMTLPVLNHIKIERTGDGWIGLTVTDLDHYLTLRLEQPSDGEPVSLLVPYDELAKIAKACSKEDRILVQTDEKNVVTLEYAIGNQVAEAKVESLPVDEFPPTPKIIGHAVPIPEPLRQSIHEALECASTDETRLILNGAYVDVSQPQCHQIVGTDGRRLYSSNSFSLPLKDSFLIPNHKFLGWKEFSRDGEWQIRVGEKTKDEPSPIQISSRRWRFISRQIEGSYPNWRQVLISSSQAKTKIELEPESLEALIGTIERMPCNDAINFVVGLEVQGKKLSLLGRSTNAEKWTKVEVQGAKTSGSDVTIFLNRHFLSTALSFGLNTVEIIDAISPLRLNNGGRQMIIMPTRHDAVASRPTAPATSSPPVPEQNGSGAAEPVHSGTDQPAASSTAAITERNPMQGTATNGSNGNGHHEESKPALETAVEQVEAVKASIKSAVGGLNGLLDTLKQVQREQRASEREVQSVRSTLEKLQSVRL